jgi:DNA-binding MarR family transcriptional regulator
MPTRLQEELKQGRPFTGPTHEALLSIERTAALLGHAFAEFLKPHGITPTQYNALRILRGAAEGLCRHEIRDRLVSQVPDVTRLLDRLEEGGLVARERDAADRRLVTTRITRRGLQLLAQLDGPVRAFDERRLGHLTPDELRTLVDLLARVREQRGQG